MNDEAQTPPQDFRTFRLGPREAAEALKRLSREAAHRDDQALAGILLALSGRLAHPGAVEALMASARGPAASMPCNGIALAFRGDDVVEAVLRHLTEATDTTARRIFFCLAIALAAFEELHRPLIAQLTHRLFDDRWFVVRNAIVLLSAIGGRVPRTHWPRLRRSAHRQVRFALAQEVARWTPDPDALEVLVPLLDDADAGTRFTAAVALGTFPHARARQALLHRSQVETDGEVVAACGAGLRRRSGERLSA